MYPNVVRMEHQSVGHADEFIVVIDSLGRKWNPLKHPRDSHGRFIRTFSFVSFNLPDAAPGTPNQVSGRVAGVDRDGSLLVKVTNAPSGSTTRIGANDYVKVKADQVEVQTVKARLRTRETQKSQDGREFTGRLQTEQAARFRKGVQTLNRLNMPEAARKLDRAIGLGEADYDVSDPRNRATAEQSKQQAIDLFREVGEMLAEERGRGFGDGDDYEEIKANLSGSERARLGELDRQIANTFTGRHQLGDRTLDVDSSEGQVPATGAERRISAIENELRKDQSDGARVIDLTSGTAVETTLEGVQKAEMIGENREEHDEDVLPELRRSQGQRERSGQDRLAGYKQGARAAVGSRFHVDADGNEVTVGSIVHLEGTTRGRRESVGMVVRIHEEKDGSGKRIFVRDFVRSAEDPVASDPRYSKGYKDFNVTSGAIRVAAGNEQADIFRQLAMEDISAKSLVEAFTEEHVAQARRLAGPGAKRISPNAGKFFDAVPVQDRVREDSTGQMIKIGDKVLDPKSGDVGTVVYIEPNSNTVKLEMPNGQRAVRRSARKLVRGHGSTDDTFIQNSQNGRDNFYMPTREEAAQLADDMGASGVAEAIRSNGDHEAIKQAMTEDEAFQALLPDADALYSKRDQTLSAGQELAAEDREALARWDKLAAASAGRFREGDPVPPENINPPEAVDGEDPQDPANPDNKVSPDGESKPSDDTTPDEGPAPVDTEEPEPTPEDEEEPELGEDEVDPASLAGRVLNDLQGMVDEAKRTQGVTGIQRQRFDKHMDALREAAVNRDGEQFIKRMRDFQKMFGEGGNRNLAQTKLATFLRGQGQGRTFADFLQSRLDSGADFFGEQRPTTPVERPTDSTDESPEGVDPAVDAADSDLAESLLDGQAKVFRGDEQVTEGFYVMEPGSVQDFDALPTREEIAAFLENLPEDSQDGVSIWRDDNGVFHMGLASIRDDEGEIRSLAEASDAQQYVNIADGTVHNIVPREANTDTDEPPEAVEDARSEQRVARKAGAGRATARTTEKQKNILDRVAEQPDAPTDVIAKVRNGEEIEGADASRLADFINGTDSGAFEKPADKGLAQQLADKLAAATGEVGPRPYPSQSTALSRSSQVSISLDAQSQDDEIIRLTKEATDLVKAGDNLGAAERFREAADRFDGMGLKPETAERARTHADRLAAASTTSEADPEDHAPESEEQVSRINTRPDGSPMIPYTPAMPVVSGAALEDLVDQQGNLDLNRLRDRFMGEDAQEDIVGLDFETTGLATSPEVAAAEGQDGVDRPWQVAAVGFDGEGTQLDSQVLRMNPGRAHHPEAAKILPPGITEADIANTAESWVDQLPVLLDYIGERTVLAQNASFDIGVIRDMMATLVDPGRANDLPPNANVTEALRALERQGVRTPEDAASWLPMGGVIDTKALARAIHSPKRKAGETDVPENDRLVTMAQFYGVEHENAHEAESDVNATWGIFSEMLERNMAGPGSVVNVREQEQRYQEQLAQWPELLEEYRQAREAFQAGGGPEAPEGGDDPGGGGGGSPDPSDGPAPDATPGAEAGTAPGGEFSVDDPGPLHAALADSERRRELLKRSEQWSDTMLTAQEALKPKIESDTAQREFEAATAEADALFDGLSMFFEELEYVASNNGGELHPWQIGQRLARASQFVEGYKQTLVNVLNGQGPNPFTADNEVDFVNGRMQGVADETDLRMREATSPDNMQMKVIAYQMARGDLGGTDFDQIRSMKEMRDKAAALTSALHMVQGLRDPQQRMALNRMQLGTVTDVAEQIGAWSTQIGSYLNRMAEDGYDVGGLESTIRAQLDQFESSHLIDYGRQESVTDLNAALTTYGRANTPTARNAAGTKVLETIGARIDEFGPGMHKVLSKAVRGTIAQALADNNGKLPEGMTKALEGDGWHKYGAFSLSFQGLDAHKMIAEGAGPEEVKAATKGSYSVVRWDGAPELGGDFVKDDRTGTDPRDVEADPAFRADAASLTPNVAKALNSLMTYAGGDIRRVRKAITEVSGPLGEDWRRQDNNWRNIEGDDNRSASEVGGVFVPYHNMSVISDDSLSNSLRKTSVLHHELGHALDWMLGSTLAPGGEWFTKQNQDFKDFHETLKRVASYDANDPNKSALYWYFRDKDEGSRRHNGGNGTMEVFAEGYAAYAYAKNQEVEEPGGRTETVRNRLIGMALSMGTAHSAWGRGDISSDQMNGILEDMGRAIYDYFDRLENETLPQIMESPSLTPVQNSLGTGQFEISEPPTGLVDGQTVESMREPTAQTSVLAKEQFSNPETPRTRQVTAEEFLQIADAGRQRLDGFRSDSAEPTGLDGRWDEHVETAWKSVQSEWGGATIDAHTGDLVNTDREAYALTVKPPGASSVSVPIGASREEFEAAMRQARETFGTELSYGQHYLGIFRDEDSTRIDFDPVLVVDNLQDAESIGAFTGNVGGAYNFADGNGYWPPYVDDAAPAPAEAPAAAPAVAPA